MISVPAITLALVAGFFFMLANLAMKFAGLLPAALSVPLVLILALVGILIEIEALKTAQFGTTVVIIIAAEIICTITVASLFMAENYTARDILGMTLMVAGIGVMASSEVAKLRAEAEVLTEDAERAPEPSPTPQGLFLSDRTKPPGRRPGEPLHPRDRGSSAG